MAERVQQSWSYVNDFLSDEYREVVVDLDLRQLNCATTPAAKNAATALKMMPVKGFRSLGHIKDRSIARAQMLRQE